MSRAGREPQAATERETPSLLLGARGCVEVLKKVGMDLRDMITQASATASAQPGSPEDGKASALAT